jgi:hypothetical protein
MTNEGEEGKRRGWMYVGIVIVVFILLFGGLYFLCGCAGGGEDQIETEPQVIYIHEYHNATLNNTVFVNNSVPVPVFVPIYINTTFWNNQTIWQNTTIDHWYNNTYWNNESNVASYFVENNYWHNNTVWNNQTVVINQTVPKPKPKNPCGW